EGVLVVEEGQRYVRREAVLGVRDREAGRRQRRRERRQLAPVHALELGVEAAPARDAVDVLHVRRPGQRVELLPVERHLLLDLAEDAEGPGAEVDTWHVARVQDGPLLRQVLPGRQPSGVVACGAHFLLRHRPEHRYNTSLVSSQAVTRGYV